MAGGLLLLFETAAGYALFKVQDGVKIQAADAQVGMCRSMHRLSAGVAAIKNNSASSPEIVPMPCRICTMSLPTCRPLKRCGLLQSKDGAAYAMHAAVCSIDLRR